MAAQRQHGTTLIAGLIVLGALGFLGGSARFVVDLDPTTRGILWFVAAFVAAHIAKRMLLRLDTSWLCAGAVVMSMLAIGIEHRHAHRTIEITILVQLGLTLAGALAGALTARRPAKVHVVFAVLGAGAAGFGASVLGIGIAMIVDMQHIASAFFLAAPLGAMFTTWFVSEVEALHTALGEAVVFAVFVGIIGVTDGSKADLVLGLMLAGVGAVIGFLLGAAGGAFGVHFRRRFGAEIPQARQVH